MYCINSNNFSLYMCVSLAIQTVIGNVCPIGMCNCYICTDHKTSQVCLM